MFDIVNVNLFEHRMLTKYTFIHWGWFKGKVCK